MALCGYAGGCCKECLRGIPTGEGRFIHGNTVLREGDYVFLYTHLHLSDASDIEI